ncbi:MAG: type IV secretory system conjugative DNA transfer family protein, partial [bacterium]|nr:type IV secretory system conjugative DNA transfer family protein [bacterium]
MIATDDPAARGGVWDSWYFWASLACFAVVFVMNVLPWLIALFAEEDEPDLVTHGSARFATDEEIAKSGLLETEHGAYLGHHAESGGGLTFGDDGHLITVATAGAGKGTCSVIPNLLSYEGSVVCTDPKGENAAITARHRREMGQ